LPPLCHRFASVGERLPVHEGERLRHALGQLSATSRAIEHHRCAQRMVDLTAPEVPPAQQHAAQQVRSAKLAQRYREALAAAQAVRERPAGEPSSRATAAAAAFGLELGDTRGTGSPASQPQLVGRLTVPSALAGGLQLQGTTRSVFGPGQLRRLNAIFAL
jgi:hypothetical protein